MPRAMTPAEAREVARQHHRDVEKISVKVRKHAEARDGPRGERFNFRLAGSPPPRRPRGAPGPEVDEVEVLDDGLDPSGELEDLAP